MAAKKPNPFAKFEKSPKDKEVKKFGKEGSKKEEAFDRFQAKKPAAQALKSGWVVGKKK